MKKQESDRGAPPAQSKTSHTPGPWRFCRGEIPPSGNRYFPHVHLGGDTDRGIRTCGSRDIVVNEGATMDECEANAKLIATAPLMATALLSIARLPVSVVESASEGRQSADWAKIAKWMQDMAKGPLLVAGIIEDAAEPPNE